MKQRWDELNKIADSVECICDDDGLDVLESKCIACTASAVLNELSSISYDGLKLVEELQGLTLD